MFKDPGLDGRALRLAGSLRKSVSASIDKITIADIYIAELDTLTEEAAASVFSDPVAQTVYTGSPYAGTLKADEWDYIIEISYKTGVTNPTAITARSALSAELGVKISLEAVIQTARQLIIKSGSLSEDQLENLKKHLYNPLIEQAVMISSEEWKSGKRFPAVYPASISPSPVEILDFDLSEMTDEQLIAFSKERLLALTADEMNAVKGYYNRADIRAIRETEGLPAGPTDVEIEMIAQTWSEHCKHKILNADVEYYDKTTGKNERISSLFKEYVKKTTDEVSEVKDYLRSVFHDNSGVIVFDDDNLICFKVETHNSPSALDPYGGAITGIVGVNRDILGTGKGARPIFNTNYLCFGEVNAPESEIPKGLLHPRQIMEGVHRGIVDGGNQSGIPVVGGGFLFDDSYTGKPLVFCGTGGILPAEIDGEGSWIKHINPGDTAVMLGGRIGKDGIHGATFSSLALDEESPTSAVQIGDPITQKKMSDFLIEARDKGLYKGLTDNGAGGLSSSLGEMAEYSNGIIINLDDCPLKYEGLAPWEILVSESQERMSLAISEDTLEEFISLAESRGVEATAIGTFTDSGYIDLKYSGKTVGMLEMEFLHKGLPVMVLNAEWVPERELVKKAPAGSYDCSGNSEMLLKLLAEPNIASKEGLIRQYDHEVLAQSVIKPFIGKEADAPSDGAVLKPVPGTDRGVTVTHGVCPRYGDADAYDMAMCGVDEAYRAHIALGGNPEKTSALDNFCWPDPVESTENPEGKYRMAQLVRACKGLRDACTAYGMPLISGKDSMKNESKLGGKKIPVRPTLLISQMGIIEDSKKAMTSDFKKAGDKIYILGETRGELGGSFFEKLEGSELGACPAVKTDEAIALYRKIHSAMQKTLVTSCHDLSDGGLACAVAECALGGRLGAEISLDKIPADSAGYSSSVLMFSETPSRFVVTVAETDVPAFEEEMSGTAFAEIGSVNDGSELVISMNDSCCLKAGLADIEKSWKSFS